MQSPTLDSQPGGGTFMIWVRRTLMAGYLLATILWLKHTGRFPSDREILVGWIMGLALLATVGKNRREALVTLGSWAPFLLALFLYDFARAVGHWIGSPLAVRPQIEVDRVLGFGKLWTERLQDWLIDDKVGLRTRPIADVERTLRSDQSTMHWYDVLVSIVYQSHFVLPYLFAGYFWRRGQRLWRWYAGCFVAVTFVACAMFALVATAPPWYAARLGLIEQFPRVLAGRGWGRVGLHFAGRVIQKGQGTVNPFAAIPSLHSAEALLVSVFLWKFVSKWWRPILVAYPLAMCFTLVYSGEHYLIDVLLGWALVGLALYVGLRLADRKGWRNPWHDGPKFDPHPTNNEGPVTLSDDRASG